MEWDRLLDLGRLGHPSYRHQPHRPAFDQDADRISFSAPFRRLANKTQVHPLYDNDHIHHRLIHSVETASVGRSLGIDVGNFLEEQGLIGAGERMVLAGVVHAACLAHDIGNPPFGHSGEDAIGAWFSARFDAGRGLFADRQSVFAEEFEAFEGNAQGFRILTNLEMYRGDGGMRLTHATLATFSKYPVTARRRTTLTERYCGLKKFGIFESEARNFESVAERTGLIAEATPDGAPWWRRHPLVFLVEAADDICYNILDLEDAFTSRDLGYHEVLDLLSDLAGREPIAGNSEAENIAFLRAMAISQSIAASVEAFRTHYDAIMAGTFSDALIDASELGERFDKIATLANTRIFTSPRKTELEVMGRNVVHQVLDGLMPVFDALSAADWKVEDLKSYPQQLARATGIDLRNVSDTYTALHALSDYVSGMTDRYAVKIAQMVRGA
ncbi:dNTP triphosphohydrolase [Martelella alba]|uniref:DNTP triphosphohydrolase n=2 Tax=Martelella alba TaxID=2590451 RepID=A0A506UK05_9HYPH|nr:dNTP triphosphohydrolase [Martelella alba]